jgi:general secretion pathway protein G
VIYLRERSLHKQIRGDVVNAVELPGRRVTLFRFKRHRPLIRKDGRRGFTLIELVITITVLTILTMGVVPLLKLSVKRQKEQQLHDALRQMRAAIDDFHRDTVGINCSGVAGVNPPGVVPPTDPRSKVIISDCTIFGVDNPDRYPPDLETLISGVNVIQRGGIGGGRGEEGVDATKVGGELSTKKKVYLRSIPINPFTGGNKEGTDWILRSCYDAPGSDSWGGENVFDVVFPRNKDDDFKPLKEGDKYSDW